MAEGIIGAFSIPGLLAVQWLATSTGPSAPATDAARALASYLRRNDVAFTATFFAVGSTLFCYLLLRGRMIPAPWAGLGVGASVLLVICLPLQLAGYIGGSITMLMWLPMLVFEVPFGRWLIARGVLAPTRPQVA